MFTTAKLRRTQNFQFYFWKLSLLKKQLVFPCRSLSPPSFLADERQGKERIPCAPFAPPRRNLPIFPIPQKFRKIRQTHKNNCQPSDIEWVDITIINFGHKKGEGQPDDRPDDKNLKLVHGQQYPFGFSSDDP
jgi:hypothetical protein